MDLVVGRSFRNANQAEVVGPVIRLGLREVATTRLELGETKADLAR